LAGAYHVQVPDSRIQPADQRIGDRFVPEPVSKDSGDPLSLFHHMDRLFVLSRRHPEKEAGALFFCLCRDGEQDRQQKQNRKNSGRGIQQSARIGPGRHPGITRSLDFAGPAAVWRWTFRKHHFLAVPMSDLAFLCPYRPLWKLSRISSRAMIIRRTSAVPAPMSHSFWSR